jgi:3-hydroxyisobutyrate dehydrogenase-like beta-hydroxyacid dehydrogenase
MSNTIGFVGLGVMGGPMAENLARAGFPVVVYDIDTARPAPLAARHAGMSVAASPRALAAASDIVVTMLPTGKHVREALFGDDGLIEGLRPGALVIDTSSSEPDKTKETAARLAEAGVGMVDAPVSGAEPGAIAGELVFMVGGDAADVARAAPLLDAMGKTSIVLGPSGSGHAMKCINNLITAVTFMATGEGLIMGTKYGLDPAAMTEVLNASTGGSWITRNHIPQRILSRTFDDQFKFALLLKDVNIALGLSQALDLPSPLSTAAQELWQEVALSIAAGASVSEMVRVQENTAGVQILPAAK